MRKIFVISVIALSILMLSACSDKNNNSGDEKVEYNKITAAQAKEIMDTNENAVILDVRTQDEYNNGHIKNAVLLPDYDVEALAQAKLTNKDAVILVYCRSGKRSKSAALKLIEMGYQNVSDFGGIIDWQYEIETN